MKKLLTLFYCIALSMVANANYTWQQLASIPSNGRLGAAGFSIGNKVYFGTGDYFSTTQYNDIWQYDPSSNTWSQMASLPGSSTRVSACAFSGNGFGYMGLGWNKFANATALYDFYKYDPTINSWSPIAQYPGTNGFNAISFVIGNMAYVGLGGNSSMYSYDPINNLWATIANFPGSAIQSASAFSVYGNGFVFGGWDGASVINELWSYNPSINSWTQKTNCPLFSGSSTAFAINGYAFVGAGGTGIQGGQVDFYQYFPIIDAWSSAPSFPGLPLATFRATVIGNTAYAFGGGDAGNNFYSNQLWKFENTSSIEDHSQLNITILYNAANTVLEIRCPSDLNGKLTFFALNGQKIMDESLLSANTSITLSPYKLKPGIYLYTIIDKNNTVIVSSKIFID